MKYTAYENRKKTDAFAAPEIGAGKYSGAIADTIAYIEREQLTDPALWALFVEQFRIGNVDDWDLGWRGEYWGKMMRGACFTYACTQNETLYRVLADSVRDIVSRAASAFETGDTELALSVEPLESCIDGIHKKIKDRHIERLQEGKCTVELGILLQDITNDFERVSDHCSNIAVCQIQVPQDELDAHEFLANMRKVDHQDFDRMKAAYKAKYQLPAMEEA